MTPPLIERHAEPATIATFIVGAKLQLATQLGNLTPCVMSHVLHVKRTFTWFGVSGCLRQQSQGCPIPLSVCRRSSWAVSFSGEDTVLGIVHPEDLAIYELLDTRRPLARAYIVEPVGRKACVFLLAALLLCVRRSQVENGGILVHGPVRQVWVADGLLVRWLPQTVVQILRPQAWAVRGARRATAAIGARHRCGLEQLSWGM